MNKLKGIVIAGNYRQYEKWCRKNQYNYTDYQYANKLSDLCGFNPIDVYYVGQYWLSPLWGSPDVALIKSKNRRKKNMIKTTWKEVIALLIALTVVLGVSIFGISKIVGLLEELTLTYFIK